MNDRIYYAVDDGVDGKLNYSLTVLYVGERHRDELLRNLQGSRTFDIACVEYRLCFKYIGPSSSASSKYCTGAFLCVGSRIDLAIRFLKITFK